MKTMLSVLMMSCAVFADSQPPVEVQKGAESVLMAYSRGFGQSSESLDPRLIAVFAAGDFDATSGRPSVAIFMVGKTMFVAASKGKGVAVSPVCGREDIIKLADSLVRPSFINSELIRKYGTGMTSVPTCGESQLRIFQYAGIDFDPIVAPVYLEITSKIGNLGEIDVRITPKTAEKMSVAIRNYIPPSGDILDVSELLVSTHAKVAGILVDAKNLREQAKRNDALRVLLAAREITGEAQRSIQGIALSLVKQEELLELEQTFCVFATGSDLTVADKAADKAAATNVVRRNVNTWVEEHGRENIQFVIQSMREACSENMKTYINSDAQMMRRTLYVVMELERLEKLEKSGELRIPLALEAVIVDDDTEEKP